MLQHILLLAVAGALGTLARCGLAAFVQKYSGGVFPWGTLAVNVVGCLIAGLLLVLFENRWTLSPENRMIILLGFFGAFTTFSTFVCQSGELMRTAEWMHAAVNIAVHNVLGFAALYAGTMLGKMA